MANLSKIFNLNRIKYNELFNDALNWIKRTYTSISTSFTPASPFYQILSVVLHLGRMILYYIEDSITGLSMETAYKPDQIRGLATLAGHFPSRTIAARGAVKISYLPQSTNEYEGEICYINNKATITNNLNGAKFTILFNADVARLNMKSGNYINANIIQGEIKYQSGTGNGDPLQSFNFQERNQKYIDELFVNVYVNNEHWPSVNSLLDLGYEQKACVVRSGQLGGVDIFFGNGDNGAIPPDGATILIEYIAGDGWVGNINKEFLTGNRSDWTWESQGFLSDGTSIDLNSLTSVTALTDIIFGTEAEDIHLTQLLAPHASRSFVLANDVNYKYFLSKMNMFSIIEVIPGTNLYNKESLQLQYNTLTNSYSQLYQDYLTSVDNFGEYSDNTQAILANMNLLQDQMDSLSTKLSDAELNDNTIFLMLIPDISKRISSTSNYFTCDKNAFFLTEDEQTNILNYIEASGQRVLTIENKILQPKVVNFSININIKKWDGYEYDELYNPIMAAISKYLLTLDRKDMIPISDIVAIVEGIDGVDSVKAWFDADVNNKNIYNEGDDFYGIDEYGDIVLRRNINNAYNTTNQTIRDIYPVFRGGFTSPSGVQYSDIQSSDNLSGLNVVVTGTSSKKAINMNFVE